MSDCKKIIELEERIKKLEAQLKGYYYYPWWIPPYTITWTDGTIANESQTSLY